MQYFVDMALQKSNFKKEASTKFKKVQEEKLINCKGVFDYDLNRLDIDENVQQCDFSNFNKKTQQIRPNPNRSYT